VTGKGSIFLPSFDFVRAPHPDEAAVVQTLLPHLAGTGWDERMTRH
jgi:hypothetical protein